MSASLLREWWQLLDSSENGADVARWQTQRTYHCSFSNFSANWLNRLAHFSPHCMLLNGFESGGGRFPSCVLRLVRTRGLKINLAGKRKRKKKS